MNSNMDTLTLNSHCIAEMNDDNVIITGGAKTTSWSPTRTAIIRLSDFKSSEGEYVI